MKYLLFMIGLASIANSKLHQESELDQLSNSQPEELFKANCSLCHYIEKDKKLIGPSLYRITKKRSEKWIFKHLIDHRSQINEGDKKAVELYHEYKNTIHPNFENLTGEQLKSIIKYLSKLS